MTDYGNPVQDFSVGLSLFLKSNENLNCHQTADVVTFIYFLTESDWSTELGLQADSHLFIDYIRYRTRDLPCLSLDSMDFSASTEALLPTSRRLAKSFL